MDFSQSEVHDEDLVPGLPLPHHEVRGLYVPVDVTAVVDALDGVEHLNLGVSEEGYQQLDGEDGGEVFAFLLLERGEVFACGLGWGNYPAFSSR